MRRSFLILILTLFAAATAFATPTPAKKRRAKTGIAWNVTPESAVIFLDGRKLGSAGKLKFTSARPGRHTIKLTKGGDEAELDVKVNKGQVLQFNYAFSE